MLGAKKVHRFGIVSCHTVFIGRGKKCSWVYCCLTTVRFAGGSLPFTVPTNKCWRYQSPNSSLGLPIPTVLSQTSLMARVFHPAVLTESVRRRHGTGAEDHLPPTHDVCHLPWRKRWKTFHFYCRQDPPIHPMWAHSNTALSKCNALQLAEGGMVSGWLGVTMLQRGEMDTLATLPGFFSGHHVTCLA